MPQMGGAGSFHPVARNSSHRRFGRVRLPVRLGHPARHGRRCPKRSRNNEEETVASLARMLLGGAMAVTALALALPAPALSQKRGRTFRIHNGSNPPSASPHEDTTIAVVMPFMAVYNNLIRFDPAEPRNSFDTIIPELAMTWEWDATKTKLTFKLRTDVKWHDGKPFTGKDVA